jgi:hypothetical protein
MYKPQSTFFLTNKRDPELIARANLLARQESLKLGAAVRRLLDKHLPTLPQNPQREGENVTAA